MADSIQCPYCDEWISANAKKCKHCGEWLTGKGSGRKGKPADKRSLIEKALASKYEIIKEIGKGGMAVVYKARHKKLNRIVALKVLHTNLVHDTEFVERFHREAELSASLDHPNIVTIYNVDQIDDLHYLEMEYLEGDDLHSYIKKKGKLSPEETLQIILPIAHALDHAHHKGIIHRDIKSSNIIFTNQRKPVLTDFGIAHAANTSKLTQTGTIIGTPEYMSPEQAQGKSVNNKSDMYSLGVVMYECLTGTVPFRGDGPLSVIGKIVNEKPLPVTRYNPRIPVYINHIVFALLEKNPDNRIYSGKQLTDSLHGKKVKTRKSVTYKPADEYTGRGTQIRSNKHEEKKAVWRKGDTRFMIIFGILITTLVSLTQFRLFDFPDWYIRYMIVGIALLFLLIEAIRIPKPFYGIIFGLYISLLYLLPFSLMDKIREDDINDILIFMSVTTGIGLFIFSVAAIFNPRRNFVRKLITVLVYILLVILGIIIYNVITLYKEGKKPDDQYSVQNKEIKQVNSEKKEPVEEENDYSDPGTEYSGIFTDPRDGQTYEWIRIGNQIWMAENLNYKTPAGSWCYNDIESNCDVHGRLYDWRTACEICPEGWHLPDDGEWTILINTLGGKYFAGGKLKTTGSWSSPNSGASNSSGFSAIPSGFRYNNGIFDDAGSNTFFWSSTEKYTGLGGYWGLSYNNDDIDHYSSSKNLGLSVRCIKNK